MKRKFIPNIYSLSRLMLVIKLDHFDGKLIKRIESKKFLKDSKILSCVDWGTGCGIVTSKELTI